MQSVVDRYTNPSQPQNPNTRAVESTTRSRIEELNRRLDEILEEKEQKKEHNKYLNEIDKTRQKGWWEETPIESLNELQVKQWIEWFQAFKDQVESQIEVLKNGGSTSALNVPDDVPGTSTGVGPSGSAPGPSYAPDMGIAGPDYGVSPQAHDPSSSQFPLRPPSSTGGGSTQPVPGQYPPGTQNPSAVGGSKRGWFSDGQQEGN